MLSETRLTPEECPTDDARSLQISNQRIHVLHQSSPARDILSSDPAESLRQAAKKSVLRTEATRVSLAIDPLSVQSSPHLSLTRDRWPRSRIVVSPFSIRR
jgi:hypothetical protein